MPPSATAKRPDLSFCIREAPGHTEKLRFEQRIGQGAAVNLHKGAVFTGTQVMHGTGQQTLSSRWLLNQQMAIALRYV